MKAQADGSLIGSGLSSSASVGLAYLALDNVNEIEPSDAELFQYFSAVEHIRKGAEA